MRVTLDSLRWRAQPARATVTLDGGPPRVHLQMTTPREVAAMCLGRPVEELPRILSILSPAHHLCAAAALDRLFGVDPPPVARNTREAMRLALIFRDHLRKFYFLVSSVENPFADFWPEGARRGPHGLRPLLDDLMRHVSAAQEAVAILGGRADHPVTAVAGGVSRALKQDHHVRLAEIALACRSFAERLASLLRERVFSQGEILGDVRALDAGPLASLALAPEPDSLVLRDGHGGEVERFASAALFDKVGLHQESWSHEPFAFLEAKGWHGLDAAPVEGLFFVGPLARLNNCDFIDTPIAEKERKALRPNAQIYLSLGGGTSLAVYLASRKYQAPRDDAVRGTPCLGLSTTNEGLQKILAFFRDQGRDVEGPITHDKGSPVAASAYVKDPGGNFLEFCVPR